MGNDGNRVLQKRFCDYMVLRGLSEKTQEGYLRAVVGLVRYYSRSPDQLSNAEIHAYLLHLIQDRMLAWDSCRVAYAAPRVFYRDVLCWDELRFSIPPRVRAARRSEVLSIQEVERLLVVAGPLKNRALPMTTYSQPEAQGPVSRTSAIEEPPRRSRRSSSASMLPTSSSICEDRLQPQERMREGAIRLGPGQVSSRARDRRCPRPGSHPTGGATIAQAGASPRHTRR